MDTAQWQQEIVVKPKEEIVTNTACQKPPPPPIAGSERKPRPQREQALNCPRCNSTNTKFCYYNNYSLTQPRYFCKTCRRYWTEGGSLRNIPVGGGSRKNKRSAPPSASSSKKLPDLVIPPNLSQSQNPKIHDGHDLNLGFSSTQDLNSMSQLVQMPNIDDKNNTFPTSGSSNSSASQLSSLELMSGTSSRGFASFMSMPDPNTVYSSGYPMQQFKQTLNFSLDGLGSSGYGGGLHGVQEGTTSGRLLFPFDDHSKQVPQNTAAEAEQSKVQGDSAGYWTGMLGGAGSW